MPRNMDSALGIHPQALLMRARRSSILAANLANADTPNYKAKDIDFRSALEEAQGGTGLTLARTHHTHLPVSTDVAGSANVMYRNPLHASLDGNTVDTEVEQTQFAENAIQYQASLHFLNSKINGMIKALKGE